MIGAVPRLGFLLVTTIGLGMRFADGSDDPSGTLVLDADAFGGIGISPVVLVEPAYPKRDDLIASIIVAPLFGDAALIRPFVLATYAHVPMRRASTYPRSPRKISPTKRSPMFRSPRPLFRRRRQP